MASNSKIKKERPKMAPVEAPAAPVEQTDDFSKVVQESKTRLHNESNKPLKRGRGRPSAVKPTGDNSSQSISKEGMTSTSPMNGPAQQSNIAPFIREPLKMLSILPAKKYKCDDLVLTDEEAALCAQAVNDLINAFIPDMSAMSPKTAAVFGAVMIFGSVGMNKAIILANHREKYKDEIKKQEAEINKQPKKEEIIKPEDMINAQDAFRTPSRGIYPTANV